MSIEIHNTQLNYSNRGTSTSFLVLSQICWIYTFTSSATLPSFYFLFIAKNIREERKDVLSEIFNEWRTNFPEGTQPALLNLRLRIFSSWRKYSICMAEFWLALYMPSTAPSNSNNVFLCCVVLNCSGGCAQSPYLQIALRWSGGLFTAFKIPLPRCLQLA